MSRFSRSNNVWFHYAAAVLGLLSAASLPALGCASSGSSLTSRDQTEAQSSALTATFEDGGGAPGDGVLVSVPRVHVDPTTHEPAYYALRIGANYHPVYGCELGELNEAIEQPFNIPNQVDVDFPEDGEPRGRLSCGDDDDFPLDSTEFWAADDATRPGFQRYFFPTGHAGEYYSFLDDVDCLGPMKSKLFKLDLRLSDYFYMESFGTPPDLTTEVKLRCGGPDAAANLPYHLYAGQDCTLPGVVGTCRPGRSNPNAAYVIVESKVNGASTYLPVYRVNGQPVSGGTAGLAALKKWLDIPDDTPLLGLPDFVRESRTFWDLCLPVPSVEGGLDAGADGGVPAVCAPHHYHHPSSTSALGAPDAAAPLGPTLYRTKLELEATSYQEAVDDASWVSPPFVGCEGALEETFGLQRDVVPVDARAWVNDQLKALQKPTAPAPRFRCPPRRKAADGSDASVCKIALGDAQTSDRRQVVSLRTLNDRISAAAAACASPRLDALEITLNSPVDIPLLPLAGVSFDRFRTVKVVGAAGQKKDLLFHEQCTDASPCLRTNFARTRTVMSLTPDLPTRALTFDHVDVGYVADNATTPSDAGAPFFELTALLVRAEGAPGDRVKVTFVDASAGKRDPRPEARAFLSQTLAATNADVFVVRSVVGGTGDPASFWKTVQVTDSLLVLAGTEGGRGAARSDVTGAGGGLRFSDGRNDVLAVNALVQGPIVSNAISRSVFVDTTLQRSPNKEAFHFVGSDTAGVPAGFHAFFQGNSRVTQMQHLAVAPSASAFVVFDSTVLPTMQMAGSVTYFDDDGVLALPTPTLVRDGTKFCSPQGHGTLRLLDPALPASQPPLSQLVCKPGL